LMLQSSLVCLSLLVSVSALSKIIVSGDTHGGVCEDGSPPVYFLRPGETEPRKWVIHLQGGGWCSKPEGCGGTSRHYPDVIDDTTRGSVCCCSGGMLSADPALDPTFHGWTLAFVTNCDGSSFSSDRQDPGTTPEGAPVYFRGRRVLRAVVEHLLRNGMRDAETVVLAGCSAGGLAVLLQGDYVRTLIPSSIPVRGLVDAGWFLDLPTVHGAYDHGDRMADAAELWNATTDSDCMAAHPNDPAACIWAGTVYPHVQLPLFIIQSKYDRWQLEHHLSLGPLVQCFRGDPNGAACSQEAYGPYWDLFHLVGETTLAQLEPAIANPKDGVYLASCLYHCLSINMGVRPPWTSASVADHSPADAVAAWLQAETPCSSSRDGDNRSRPSHYHLTPPPPHTSTLTSPPPTASPPPPSRCSQRHSCSAKQGAHVFVDECAWPCNPSCHTHW